jgi:hypothetical protein
MGCTYRGTLRPLCGLPPPCPLHQYNLDISFLFLMYRDTSVQGCGDGGQWPLSPLKSVGYTETDSFETH